MVMKRIAAFFYDCFILLALFCFFSAVCLVSRRGVSIEPYTLWFQISLIGIVYTYFAFSWKKGGQTIGMRAWKIKLISIAPLTHLQILARLSFAPLAVICGILTGKSTQYWLEKISKTKIITIN